MKKLVGILALMVAGCSVAPQDTARNIGSEQARQEEAQRRLDGAAERFDASRDRYAEQRRDTVRQNEVTRRP